MSQMKIEFQVMLHLSKECKSSDEVDIFDSVIRDLIRHVKGAEITDTGYDFQSGLRDIWIEFEDSTPWIVKDPSKLFLKYVKEGQNASRSN